MKPVLQLIRLPNGFSAVSNVAAGSAAALALGLPVAGLGGYLAAGIGALFLYAFGMALNDLADVEKDRHLHPERPIPSGRISIRQAQLLIAFLLVGGMGFLGLAHPALLLVGLALAAAIVLYDVVLKSRPMAAAATMGLCRALCVGLGIVYVALDHGALDLLWTWETLVLPAGYLLLITAVTAVSNFEEGANKQADLRPLSLLLAAALLLPGLSRGPSWEFALMGAAFLAIWVTRPAWQAEGRAGLVVRNTIFSLPLVDALWSFGLEQPRAALVSIGCWVMLQMCARLLAQKDS